MADSGRGVAAPGGADDLGSDDEMDEDERAAIEEAMRLAHVAQLAAFAEARRLQHVAQQPVPQQLPPPPQASLLNKMTESIQKKDKQEKEMDADEDKEEQ